MPRALKWLIGCAGAALLGGLILAFSVRGPARDQDRAPRFALKPAPGIVPVRLSRENGGSLMSSTLVWLPVAAGLMTLIFAHLLYRLPKTVVIWVLVLVGIVLLLVLSPSTLGPLLGLILAAFLVVAVAFAQKRRLQRGPAVPLGRQSNARAGHTRGFRVLRRLHLATVAMLLLSGVFASATMHIILVRYRQTGPASPRVELAELREAANIVAARSGVWQEEDVNPVAAYMERIPAINDLSFDVTIFGLNRFAAIVYIVTGLVYLIVWVLLMAIEKWRMAALHDIQFIRRIVRVLTIEVRLLFAISFYVAMGSVFAILYYNIYLGAASKQNSMLKWATHMQLEQAEAKRQLQAAKEDLKWSEAIERQMLEQAVGGVQDPKVAQSLEAIRAQYWPSTVIAQEKPWPKTEGGLSYTAMTLNPFVTLNDMFYFSFVSFTTTGYGDIKPVSEQLRFWTVFENIMEILFAAMFFVVAMDGGRRVESKNKSHRVA